MLNRPTTLLVTLVPVLTVVIASMTATPALGLPGDLVADAFEGSGRLGPLEGQTADSGQVWGGNFVGVAGAGSTTVGAYGVGGGNAAGGTTGAGIYISNYLDFPDIDSGHWIFQVDVTVGAGQPQYGLQNNSVAYPNGNHNPIFRISGGSIEVQVESLPGSTYVSTGVAGGGTIRMTHDIDFGADVMTIDWEEVGGTASGVVVGPTSISTGLSGAPGIYKPDRVAILQNPPGTSGFDNIRLFKVVPEPATVTLLGIGGLALLRRRRAA